jgi:AraC family transcriptional regulator
VISDSPFEGRPPGSFLFSSHAAAERSAAATGAQPLFTFDGLEGLFAVKWRLPPFRAGSVWSPQHVLSYRTSGTATITRSFGGRQLRKVPLIGSVTFAPGDQPAEWMSDAQVEAIHVYIAAAALERAAARLGLARAPRIRDFFGIVDPWLSSYFQLLECEYEEERVAGAPRAGSLFLQQTEHLLLRHLLRHYADGTRAPRHDARGGVTPLRTGLVRRVQDYIDANLASDLSLEALAALAHMSVDHFLRAFRAATGTTPHRFVREHRLARAARLLGEGGASVAQIARGCGFRSAAHFSVRFQARFGVTPSQYRRAP